MKIIVSPLAEKGLRKLSKVNQIVVAKRIRALATSGPRANDEQLKGYKNILRTRIGDIRIVYKKTKTIFYIILVGQRKDIYEKLKRLLT